MSCHVNKWNLIGSHAFLLLRVFYANHSFMQIILSQQRRPVLIPIHMSYLCQSLWRHLLSLRLRYVNHRIVDNRWGRNRRTDELRPNMESHSHAEMERAGERWSEALMEKAGRRWREAMMEKAWGRWSEAWTDVMSDVMSRKWEKTVYASVCLEVAFALVSWCEME